MSTTSQLTESLHRILENPNRGVVGLVDDLLKMCQKGRLRLDWTADRCRVCSFGGAREEVIDLPLRKSVFRAILARIATLCNEHTPNSVSPYGGKGKLLIDASPSAVFKVTFVNSSTEQKLELMATATSIPGNSQLIAGGPGN